MCRCCERAYANWDDLEARTGERVLYRTGAVYIGRPDSELIAGSLASAQLHSPAVRSAERRSRNATMVAATRTGWLSRRCTKRTAASCSQVNRFGCTASRALRHGAHVRAAETVLEWRETATGVEVVTAHATYRAAHLIVTVGSWAGGLLPRLPTPLEVTRQALFWVWPRDTASFELDTFPCWAAQLDGYDGLFYGFPMLPAGIGGQLGFKIAHHARGQLVEPGAAWPIDVAEFDVGARGAETRSSSTTSDPVVATKACMYTSTIDGHFVVDRYPGQRARDVACGFSGHGFKFASVIGEALADLALEGRTDLPIGFLGLERFQNQRHT